MCLQFWFVIFREKEIGAKADRKMLVKLTKGLLLSPTRQQGIRRQVKGKSAARSEKVKVDDWKE